MMLLLKTFFVNSDSVLDCCRNNPLVLSIALNNFFSSMEENITEISLSNEAESSSQLQHEASATSTLEDNFIDELDSLKCAFGANIEQKNARQCPRCLNIYSQKIGCNYVRCPNLLCNTWFCWECGKKDIDWTHFLIKCKPSWDDMLKGLYLVKFVFFIGVFTTVFITPSMFLICYIFGPLAVTLGFPAYVLHAVNQRWVDYKSGRLSMNFLQRALGIFVFIMLYIILLPLGSFFAVLALIPITLFWLFYVALLFIKLIPIIGQIMMLLEFAEWITGCFGCGDWLGSYKNSTEWKRKERALNREFRRQLRRRHIKTP